MVLFLLIFFQLLSTASGISNALIYTQKSEANYYEQGKKILAEGNWEKAIETWIDGKNSLDEKGMADPRLAFSILETSVEHDAPKYYPQATNIYYWALKKSNFEQWKEPLNDEIARTMPIVPDSIKQSWDHKLKENDASVLTDVFSYWASQDFLLSTTTNERLIEHWKRISVARNQFTQNKESVYGTDARGLIFVKYGNPDFVKSGPLFLEKTKIRELLADIKTYRGVTNLSEIFNLQMSIQAAYQPIYAEFWKYNRFKDSAPVIFIFGKSADGSPFQLRKSVEELIPSNAFRTTISVRGKTSNSITGYNAGSFIQMSLYNKLTTVDNFFGDMLNYYERNWIDFMRGRMNSSAFEQLTTPIDAEQKMWRIQHNAPKKDSELERRLSNIDHKLVSYRYLDDKNEPAVRLFLFPHLFEKGENFRLFDNQEGATEIFQIRNTLKGYSPTTNKEIVLRKNINLGSSEPFEKIFLNYASFFETELKQNYQYQYGTELYRAINWNDSKINPTNKTSIIASKSTDLPFIRPLSNDPDKLQVSDLILGFNESKKNHYWDNIAFSISPDREIPYSKNLNFYFEAYHLNAPDRLNIEYQLQKKVDKNYKDTDVKIKLNFITQKATFKKQIEVNTSELQEGDYQLLLTFSTGPASGNKITKSARFTVAKN